METENKSAIRLALREYYRQLITDWRYALLAFLLPAIGSTLVFYVSPLIVAKMLSLFGNNRSLSIHDFTGYIVIFTALWAIGELLWRIAMYFLARLEIRGMEHLYISGLKSLLEKDLGFFNDEFGGSLTKKVIGYGRRYETVLDTLAFNVVPQVIPMLFGLVILWLISAWLALALIFFILISLSIIVPLIRRRQKMVAAREEANNIMSGHISDTITNIDAVKSYAQESHEMNVHTELVKDFLQKTLKTWDYHNQKINVVVSPLYVVVNTIGLVLAVWLSTKTHARPEVLFITFSYYTTAARIVWNFHEIYRTIEVSLSDAAQFTELLLEPPRLKDPQYPQSFKPVSSDIEFKQVSFNYSDSGGDHLFQNLNLIIKSGEKVALVGHSGGGKTTITRLLLRFMDVNEGEILIGSQNIAEVKQSDLRDYIAYVPQEPIMFHRSLKENIKYGRTGASDKEVIDVGRLAHATEFIEKLPNGYDTLVGERGVKLSGGQRQRIAIARAMLKDAPILVLDEATSALDSESEKFIQKALWRLMKGRSTLVIAHRLSTIQRMDRIVVLEEGKIVEQGNHKELLAKNGVYASLWAHQSGGFLED